MPQKSRYAALVIFLFFLPFSVATYLLLQEKLSDIRFAQNEYAGIRIHHALFHLYADLSRIRIHDEATLPPPSDFAKIEQLITQVDRACASRQNLCLGWPGLAIQIRHHFTPNPGGKHDSYAQKTASIQPLRLHARQVALQSGAILDPIAETYLRIDLIVNNIPDYLEELVRLERDLLSKDLHQDTHTPAAHNLILRYGHMESIYARMIYNLEKISSLRDLRLGDQKFYYDLLGKTKKMGDMLEQIANEHIPRPVAAIFITLNKEWRKTLITAYDRYSLEIEHLLQQRIQAERAILYNISLSLLVAFLASLMFFHHTYRNMINRDAVTAADEINQKNTELEKARASADHANRMKSEFLANMSHEIRTPMNAVVGMSELLAETSLTTQQQKYVRAVLSSARHLLTVINDILDFSKIEAGRMAIEHVPFSLRTMVDDTVAIVMQEALDKHLDLQVEIDPQMPQDLIGDPLRIGQIILNLLTNAIKFTPQGSVRLHIIPSTPPNEQHLVMQCTVTDSGIGIPTSAQDKLFNKFSQVDSTTTRQYGGSGLGLAICKQLAQAMGGDIGVDSEPGQGSRFWFTVHVQPQSTKDTCGLAAGPTPASPTQPTDLAGLQNLRVLVVDDSLVNQEYLAEILLTISARVHYASNGQQVLDMIDNDTHDLVLMDCQMPIMDGYQATQHLRARNIQTRGRPVPVIALTAHALPEDRQKCLDAGMNDYLSKPVRKADLLAMMEKWHRV